MLSVELKKKKKKQREKKMKGQTISQMLARYMVLGFAIYLSLGHVFKSCEPELLFGKRVCKFTFKDWGMSLGIFIVLLLLVDLVQAIIVETDKKKRNRLMDDIVVTFIERITHPVSLVVRYLVVGAAVLIVSYVIASRCVNSQNGQYERKCFFIGMAVIMACLVAADFFSIPLTLPFIKSEKKLSCDCPDCSQLVTSSENKDLDGEFNELIDNLKYDPSRSIETSSNSDQNAIWDVMTTVGAVDVKRPSLDDEMPLSNLPGNLVLS